MIEAVTNLNRIVIIVMTLAYLYQILYLIVGLIYKNKKNNEEEAPFHRFAVLISARNEESVIGELVESLKKQKYPRNMYDIFVLADNCTDNTAVCAKKAGAIVYERWNAQLVGKGYALDYLIKEIKKDYEKYDGYFVFDADNVVDENFIYEMNKTFNKGYDAITSYRNSKNFGTNWISAAYSIWFLREARFLNFPRMLLNTNCHISGTGFCISDRIVEKNGGWPFHLLTEDIQFSVNCAIEGNRIGYCDKAMVYDEQPVTFAQSWTQRMRWSKGFYQVNANYLVSLIKGSFGKSKLKFSCYDMFMTTAPGMLLTLFIILFNAVMIFACVTQPYYIANVVIKRAGKFIIDTLFAFYLGLFVYGLITVFSEWDMIKATKAKKLIYVALFPIFMATYIPISVVALVKKVEWKPIQHFSSDNYALEAKNG
ncbi:MAG: glycosyltransferase [Lachnospiraceae bacterium]|nr:glycosyltransferase [Lachnospiraceae bacterium]